MATGDLPMPECYAVLGSPVPALWRCYVALERPVPMPAPQSCCSSSDHAAILAGQPVTAIQLHVPSETTPSPPGPPALPIIMETPRPPPPEAGWPGPKETPATPWSLATLPSENVPTPLMQPMSGGRAPPQANLQRTQPPL
ncbi:unnamed protein product [Coccothraustes coccothraustes]